MPFQIDGRGDMNAFVLTSPLAGVMLLTRRQPFYPSAAHDEFRSICTLLRGYTEFGIVPKMAGRAQVNHLRESKYRLLSMRSPTVESVLDIAGFLSEIRRSMPSTRVPSLRSKFAPAPVRSTSHRTDADNHTFCPPPSLAVAFKPLRSLMETLPSTRTS